MGPPLAKRTEVPPESEVAESKVPRATLAFWVIKICATTVGETGGDAVSMTLGLGYGVSTLIFLLIFAATLFVQVGSRRFHPIVYWSVVVGTTTVGTTTSDYFDRTLGLGYVRSSGLLLLAVIALLVAWRRTTGALAFDSITSRADEIFYWVTILVSNTLGTALGDFVATTTGLGFERGAVVFGGLIALVAIAAVSTRAQRPVLFWAAYILTRPLGATLGDTLTKSHDEGGLALGRIASSVAIAMTMAALVAATAQRRGRATP